MIRVCGMSSLSVQMQNNADGPGKWRWCWQGKAPHSTAMKFVDHSRSIGQEGTYTDLLSRVSLKLADSQSLAWGPKIREEQVSRWRAR